MRQHENTPFIRKHPGHWESNERLKMILSSCVVHSKKTKKQPGQRGKWGQGVYLKQLSPHNFILLKVSKRFEPWVTLQVVIVYKATSFTWFLRDHCDLALEITHE